MIKKNLKKWNEEIEARIDDTKIVGDSQFQSDKNKLTSKAGFLPVILGVLGIIVSIMLINGKVWIISAPTDLFLTLSYASLMILIFVLFICALYNRRSNVTKKLFLKNKSLFSKTAGELEREYQKKYKYTYKYYLTGIGNKFKKNILLLDKTSIGESRVKEVENIVSESNKKIILSTKKEKNLKVARFFISFLSVCACGYVVVFTIYEIVMHFIKK